MSSGLELFLLRRDLVFSLNFISFCITAVEHIQHNNHFNKHIANTKRDSEESLLTF